MVCPVAFRHTMILFHDRVEFRSLPPKSETGLPSFGERLKQEREKRKITLEEISVSTKIGTRMLQALEEDKFNQLPGGIFNKGFVRAYSRFVGLDEEQAVADYLQASGDAPPPPTEIVAPEEGEREPGENIRRMEAASDSTSRPLPWGWFAALLLLVALALSLWSHQRRERDKAPAPVAPVSAQKPASTSQSGPKSSQDSGTQSSAAVSPGSSAQPAPLLVATSKSQASSGVAPAPKNSEPAETAPAPGEFTVAVRAREESWVSISSDGRLRSSELMTAGTERSVRARTQVMVKMGNAGGVDLRFNGTKLDSKAEFGEVKTVTFGPAGVVPNPAIPPSTP
jgi:cytoskeleton protein RodZ